MKPVRIVSVAIFLATCFVLVSSAVCLSADLSPEDKAIIEAGVKIAKKDGLNPIPICSKSKGGNFIPSGYLFTISNGNFSVKDKDMVINATKDELTIVDVKIQRGEYVYIQGGKAVKGNKKLVASK